MRFFWIVVTITVATLTSKANGETKLLIQFSGTNTSLKDAEEFAKKVLAYSNNTLLVVTVDDVNECNSSSLNSCSGNATCTNTEGSFNCTCLPGFLEGNSDDSGKNCSDEDECLSNTHNCASNATCSNTEGGFNCSCDAGYVGNGTHCSDEDECLSNTHNCASNATCSNTDGGFNCSCDAGYVGNGTHCSDKDECLSNTHNCASNATCSNTEGGFNCSCDTGYVGNGTHCSDKDECLSNTHNCTSNATCSNTDGGFNCSCDAGYVGNGTHCSEIQYSTEEPSTTISITTSPATMTSSESTTLVESLTEITEETSNSSATIMNPTTSTTTFTQTTALETTFSDTSLSTNATTEKLTVAITTTSALQPTTSETTSSDPFFPTNASTLQSISGVGTIIADTTFPTSPSSTSVDALTTTSTTNADTTSSSTPTSTVAVTTSDAMLSSASVTTPNELIAGFLTTNADTTLSSTPDTISDEPITTADGDTTLPSVPDTTSDKPITTVGVDTTLPSTPDTISDEPITTADGDTTLPTDPDTTSDEPITTVGVDTTLPSTPDTISDEPITTADGDTTLPSVPDTTSDKPITTVGVDSTLPSTPDTISDEPITTADGGTTLPSVPDTTSDEPITTAGADTTLPFNSDTTSNEPFTTSDEDTTLFVNPATTPNELISTTFTTKADTTAATLATTSKLPITKSTVSPESRTTTMESTTIVTTVELTTFKPTVRNTESKTMVPNTGTEEFTTAITAPRQSTSDSTTTSSMSFSTIIATDDDSTTNSSLASENATSTMVPEQATSEITNLLTTTIENPTIATPDSATSDSVRLTTSAANRLDTTVESVTVVSNPTATQAKKEASTDSSFETKAQDSSESLTTQEDVTNTTIPRETSTLVTTAANGHTSSKLANTGTNTVMLTTEGATTFSTDSIDTTADGTIVVTSATLDLKSFTVSTVTTSQAITEDFTTSPKTEEETSMLTTIFKEGTTPQDHFETTTSDSFVTTTFESSDLSAASPEINEATASATLPVALNSTQAPTATKNPVTEDTAASSSAVEKTSEPSTTEPNTNTPSTAEKSTLDDVTSILSFTSIATAESKASTLANETWFTSAFTEENSTVESVASTTMTRHSSTLSKEISVYNISTQSAFQSTSELATTDDFVTTSADWAQFPTIDGEKSTAIATETSPTDGAEIDKVASTILQESTSEFQNGDVTTVGFFTEAIKVTTNTMQTSNDQGTQIGNVITDTTYPVTAKTTTAKDDITASSVMEEPEHTTATVTTAVSSVMTSNPSTTETTQPTSKATTTVFTSTSFAITTAAVGSSETTTSTSSVMAVFSTAASATTTAISTTASTLLNTTSSSSATSATTKPKTTTAARSSSPPEASSLPATASLATATSATAASKETTAATISSATTTSISPTTASPWTSPNATTLSATTAFSTTKTTRLPNSTVQGSNQTSGPESSTTSMRVSRVPVSTEKTIFSPSTERIITTSPSTSSTAATTSKISTTKLTTTTAKSTSSGRAVSVPDLVGNDTKKYLVDMEKTLNTLGKKKLNISDANKTVDNFKKILDSQKIVPEVASIMFSAIDKFANATDSQELPTNVGSKMTQFVTVLLEEMDLSAGPYDEVQETVVVRAIDYPSNITVVQFSGNVTGDAGSISLPGAFIRSSFTNRKKRNVKEPEDFRFAFAHYSDSRLFVDSNVQIVESGTDSASNVFGNRARIVNTPVMSASIANREIRDSNEFAIITLNVLVAEKFVRDNGNGTSDTVSYTSEPKCVFWNYSSHSWSSSGCELVQTSGKSVTCRCNHLTSFAVIMSVETTVDDRVLTYLSYIGAGLSIIGLVLTIITYTTFQSLRKHRSKKLLLHFCGALCGVYITYILGIAAELPANQAQCITSGFFLHFFTLSVMTWMSVEVFDMYLMFVRVMRNGFHKYVLKASLFAWGLPLLVAIITVGIHHGLPDRKLYPKYKKGAVCWLGKNGMLYAFIVPSSVLLAINLIFFSIVLYNVTCKRNRGVVNQIGKSSTKNVKATQHIINALALLLLAGPTWIIGYFINVDPIDDGVLRRTLAYIFVFLNAFQGFWIFIVFCIRPAPVRRRWTMLITKGVLQETSRTSTVSGSHRHTTKTLRSPRPSMLPPSQNASPQTVSPVNKNGSKKTTHSSLSSFSSNSDVVSNSKFSLKSSPVTPLPPTPSMTRTDSSIRETISGTNTTKSSNGVSPVLGRGTDDAIDLPPIPLDGEIDS